MEEWRMGRDAAGRLQEAYWKLILEGSRFEGLLLIIGTHCHDRLNQTYGNLAYYIYACIW